MDRHQRQGPQKEAHSILTETRIKYHLRGSRSWQRKDAIPGQAQSARTLKLGSLEKRSGSLSSNPGKKSWASHHLGEKIVNTKEDKERVKRRVAR